MQQLSTFNPIYERKLGARARVGLLIIDDFGLNGRTGRYMPTPLGRFMPTRDTEALEHYVRNFALRLKWVRSRYRWRTRSASTCAKPRRVRKRIWSGRRPQAALRQIPAHSGRSHGNALAPEQNVRAGVARRVRVAGVVKPLVGASI